MKHVKNSLFLLTLLILFTSQLPATIIASYLLAIVYLLLRAEKTTFSRTKFGVCTAICILLLASALTFNHGPTPLIYLTLSPFLLLMSDEFSKDHLDTIEGSLRNVYWIFVSLIAIALIVFRDEPEPLGAILPWASTNGIPSYLIVVQIAFSLAHYLKYDRLPILSTIITLTVAVYGLGRGSMIVGFLLVLISILINISIAKSNSYRSITTTITFTAMLIATALILVNFDQLEQAINVWIEGSKFSGGILDEHRGRILTDYLKKIDGATLLFGSDYENTSITQHYGGNPHNSYIRAHSFYGIGGLILVTTPLLMMCLSRKELKQKIVFILLTSLALLRAASEPIFFPSTLDFFYALYFFMFFRFSRPVKKVR
ncbi:hypothetical protein MCEZEM1_01782 [Comamonadaceae bacterium]